MKIIDSFPTPVVVNHIEGGLDELFPSDIDSIIKAISNNQEGQYASEDFFIVIFIIIKIVFGVEYIIHRIVREILSLNLLFKLLLLF